MFLIFFVGEILFSERTQIISEVLLDGLFLCSCYPEISDLLTSVNISLAACNEKSSCMVCYEKYILLDFGKPVSPSKRTRIAPKIPPIERYVFSASKL